MKLKNIISRFGTEAVIDEDTKLLYDYDNIRRKVMYNAQVVEDGVYVNSCLTYEEDGTVDLLEERLTKFANPLRAAYTDYIRYDRKKNDPDGRIYRAFVDEVREKEGLFFTEEGNFRDKFAVSLNVFGKRVVFNN